MGEPNIDVKLDLRGVICPLNFVKAKLRLEEMQGGEVLEVVLDDEEATANVPRSLKNEGHEILKIEKSGGSYVMLVKKSG